MFAAGTNALLRCDGAFVIPLFNTQKNILELVHSGICKKKGRVVCRKERRRMHDLMPVALKIFQEFLPDLAACHKVRILSHRLLEKTAKKPGANGTPGYNTTGAINSFPKGCLLPNPNSDQAISKYFYDRIMTVL
jgi:hypothetical protein